MDDSGQPGGEPAEVSGNGAHNQGVNRVDANGWQQPAPFDPRPDGGRGDAPRPGASRPAPSYAEGSWSAGVRESAMEPIPSWRRSAVTQLTDRPDEPRRLADLLAPVNPPEPTPFPFDNGPAPDGQFPAPEPATGQPAPGPAVNGSAMNGSADHYADRSLPRDGRPSWAPRSMPGPGIDEHATPYAGFESHHAATAPYDPSMPAPGSAPALAETTAATVAAHGTDAHDAGTSPRTPWPDNGARPPVGSPWAVPAPGRPTPAPPAVVPFRAPGPVDRHRYGPENAEPDSAPRHNGTAPDHVSNGHQRPDAPAPVSPAVPFPGTVAPARPSTQPWQGSDSRAGGAAYPGPSRADAPWNRADPPWNRAEADRPDAPRTGMARPDAPNNVYALPGRAELGLAQAGPPVAGPDAARREHPAQPVPAEAPPEPKATGRPGLEPPTGAPAAHEAATAREPVDESVLDDPWADPARYAAVYRESMSAIRAASAGVAAAEARAAAEDRAAVQAAYTQAVDATKPAPEPRGPNTPLGQPSLADYVDRPVRADQPRVPVVPRQAGPADDAVPVAQAAPGGGRVEQLTYGKPSSHAAPSGRPQTIQATPLSQATPGQPGPFNQSEPSAPQQSRAGHRAPGQPAPAPAGQSPLPVPPRLPQRVPAAPDVPEVPEDDLADDDFVDHGPDLTAVDPPELARIATGLRYNEDLEEPPRPDGFDTLAVLAAVRAVPGVRDAQLRPNPTGAGVHTLRLDLADGADGAQVSRLVARLLKQRMGLAAEPRRTGEPRRPVAPPHNAPSSPAPTVGTSAPNVGQPHRDSGSMPVAGAAPAPRIPIPTSAAEHLGGPVAANADDRSRHRPVPAPRARALEPDESHRVIRSAVAPRVVIDQVQVSTLGLDATVEVRLTSGGTPAIGVASGPAVDGYVLRLAAVAATAALDQLLATVDSWDQPGRCFVEHAAVVPFGGIDVAVVVVLLVCGTAAEQLTGAALVSGDPRQAVVRATLAAVNRRLDTLLG